MAGPHDDLLRQRLISSDDLAADRTFGPFDEVVAEAVRRFQVRHGLAATATVTPRTLAALNVTVHKRIRQLEASLERIQNMNFQFGPRYVVVNIPAAFAEAVENDVVARRYRVIVGKEGYVYLLNRDHLGGFDQGPDGADDVVQRTVYLLRSDVEDKLGRLPLQFFDNQPRGELLSRVTNDIDNVSLSLQQTISQLLSSVLTVVGVMVNGTEGRISCFRALSNQFRSHAFCLR